MSPILSFLLACTVNVDDGKNADGAGAGGEENRNVGGFSGVVNKSDADVVLVQNKSGDGLDAGDIQITCEGGVTANVDTNIDADGNLIIEFAADVASVVGCEIRVVVDTVEDVVGDGDGDIVCEDPLRDVKTIEVRGNGSVDLAEVEADELRLIVAGNGALRIGHAAAEMTYIELKGAGDAELGGETANCDLTISGNGDLRAREFTVSDTLDALLNGTGNAVITVLGTVNAEVHGDASLEVYGGAEAGEIVEVGGGEVIFY